MIFQFKVTLKGIRPPIWRRFHVEDNITFEQLHYILQGIMGWWNTHLYSFNLGHILIEIPDPYYSSPMYDTLDARKEKVAKHLTEEGQKLLYTYDFGDDWEHLLVLEKILPKEKGQKYPICLKGKRNCPPEDCGGVWGYMELLEILQNPDHPEYEEMVNWVEEGYDPEEFDIDEVNKRLQMSIYSTKN